MATVAGDEQRRRPTTRLSMMWMWPRGRGRPVSTVHKKFSSGRHPASQVSARALPAHPRSHPSTRHTEGVEHASRRMCVTGCAPHPTSPHRTCTITPLTYSPRTLGPPAVSLSPASQPGSLCTSKGTLSTRECARNEGMLSEGLGVLHSPLAFACRHAPRRTARTCVGGPTVKYVGDPPDRRSSQSKIGGQARVGNKRQLDRNRSGPAWSQ